MKFFILAFSYLGLSVALPQLGRTTSASEPQSTQLPSETPNKELNTANVTVETTNKFYHNETMEKVNSVGYTVGESRCSLTGYQLPKDVLPLMTSTDFKNVAGDLYCGVCSSTKNEAGNVVRGMVSAILLCFCRSNSSSTIYGF